MSQKNIRFITEIIVEKLFGMYNYTLSMKSTDPDLKRMMILYGDNGCGKTSILKLIFHLLAPEDNEGHKSEVASIPFMKIEIRFTDSSIITAYRENNCLIGSFNMEIKHPRKEIQKVEFICKEGYTIRAESDEESKTIHNFLKLLEEFNLTLYMLSDDRTIHLAGNKILKGFNYEFGYNKELLSSTKDIITTNRTLSKFDPEKISQYLLKQTIKRAERWIQYRAIIDSSQGESSVNALYDEILGRIIKLPEERTLDSYSTKLSIVKRVKKIEKEYSRFAKYSLLPKFSVKKILSAVSSAPSSHLGVVATVLNPYLESLEKKLEALSNTYARLDKLVSIINSFITNKNLSYNLHEGFKIIDKDNKILDESMLSSGERHLLLLFCNSFSTSDRPSIMIIDEPEISLNIKWQRELVTSLMECVGDSPVQYIFATHSIELLAQHRNRVIKLTSP